MMAGYWPTPLAAEQAPVVADGMNKLRKVVFSKTLKRAEWANTTVINDNPPTAIRKLKGESGPDMVIFGSGTIIAPLAEHGLIDEYQIVVVPIVLGSGRTMFAGVSHRLPLALTRSRSFGNGNVVLHYEPKA
jgi:dihydrofolate reductase